ncbi:hypothetical protein PF004_g2308 [Phytophthora fragariae]|uniref:Uncharacterized protein n=1 Tax=Phytophthora fragariae TaxID=53985 RepID=A0A6G0PPS9_9STRA|nr:hypothetical protein PF004_g2308 [Phytophthora fragariae]
MKLTDVLRSRIERKQEQCPPTYEKPPDVVEMLRKATNAKLMDTASTPSEAAKIPQSISLDMYITFREEFASGWNIWLGDEEVATLAPELKGEMPSMSFDEKADMFFRLSVWTKKKYGPNAQNINEIPDGAELYVERVTGLSLFENKLAQGNTNRIELVMKVDDPDSDVENASSSPSVPESQSTEGNQTDHELLSPKPQKKRRAVRAIQGVDEARVDQEGLVAEQHNKARSWKKLKTE